MATWKKVLVSGSSIEIAAITSSATPTVGAIGSNYVVMIDPTTGYVSKITSGNFQAGLGQYAYTASADTGTPVIIGSADTSDIAGGLGTSTAVSTTAGGAEVAITLNTGSTHFTVGAEKAVFDAGNFVDSSEVNFTVTAGASVTAALIDGSIANARLVNSSVYVAGGNGLTGDGSIALGASGSLAVGAGTGISVNANDVQLKNAGSLTNNYVTKWDSGNGQLTNSVIVDSGALVTIGQPLFVNGAITGSAVSASGAITGQSLTSATNITATAGNIIASAGYAQIGSNTTVPNAGIVGDIAGQHGLFDLATIGTLNVSQNAVITGDLTVNGTTTTVNTDNLLVEDKFVLFASGSTTGTDGGIVVQSSAGGGTATGYAYGYENTADRWVYQDGLAYNATAFGTPTAYAVSAEWSAGAPSAAPSYGGASYGYGNIHVNTSTGDIFIYS